MQRPASRGYRPQAEDTDPAIDRRLMAAYRGMTPGEKARRVAADSRAVEQLALAGLGIRRPNLTPEQKLSHLARLRLPETVADLLYSSVERPASMPTADPIALAVHVAAIMERLGIACAVGGSVASSVFGEPRATEDVDFVADVRPHHVSALTEALGAEFYVDEDAVRRAVSNRRSFNVIHLASARKVDVFVPPEERFYAQQIERRRLVTVSDSPLAQLFLLSPEDAILQKLARYRKGGSVSDRQWRDVVGIIKVQGEALDWPYLRNMAHDAGLGELLANARSDAGLE